MSTEGRVSTASEPIPPRARVGVRARVQRYAAGPAQRVTAAREIAPFGIGPTIVEPGATPTGFGRALDTAPVMPEYDATPAGDVRRAVTGGTLALPGDPQKIAAAMIALVDSGETPLRLPLGPDTYDDVRAALAARLAEHDAHREVAYSVTRDELSRR